MVDLCVSIYIHAGTTVLFPEFHKAVLGALPHVKSKNTNDLVCVTGHRSKYHGIFISYDSHTHTHTHRVGMYMQPQMCSCILCYIILCDCVRYYRTGAVNSVLLLQVNMIFLVNIIRVLVIKLRAPHHHEPSQYR